MRIPCSRCNPFLIISPGIRTWPRAAMASLHRHRMGQLQQATLHTLCRATTTLLPAIQHQRQRLRTATTRLRRMPHPLVPHTRARPVSCQVQPFNSSCHSTRSTRRSLTEARSAVGLCMAAFDGQDTHAVQAAHSVPEH